MTATSASGSVGDEAARLLEALQDAARTWQRGRLDDDEHAEDDAVPQACRVCPLCQLIAGFQHVRPGTVQHLADAAASLTAALADLVPAEADRAARRGGSHRGSTDSGGEPGPRDVEHIDITD